MKDIVKIIRVIAFEGTGDAVESQMKRSMKDGTYRHGKVDIHIATLHQFPIPVGTDEVIQENTELKQENIGLRQENENLKGYLEKV